MSALPNQLKPSFQALVSVIIPFFNPGGWLKEAIDSVIGQTYRDWEIILVDDGSEQADSMIAQDYSARFPGKIIYTDHPGHINRGVTISRNLGIALSGGDYIAFLDSDDCWLPMKLEQQLTLFHRFPDAAMICEASVFWYSWKDPFLEDVIVAVGTEPETLYHPPELMYKIYPLGNGAPPCPTGIVIKKQAFERSGGFEPAFSGIHQLYEDQAFLSKIYLREKVFVSRSANNLYRKRDGSLSKAAEDANTYREVRTFFLKWLEDYLLQHDLTNTQLSNLIRKARTELGEG